MRKTLAKHVFVSCWTDVSKESIPMWRMYASEDAGVRIKLRTAPFALHDNTDLLEEHGSEDFEKMPLTVVPQAEMMERGYFVTPMIYDNSLNMVREIEYVDDTNKLRPRVVSETEDGPTAILDPIGIYKNTHWDFQHEWRYLLHAFDVGANLDKNGRKAVFEALREGFKNNSTTPPFEYYDMPIERSAFTEMEITLSPKMSAGNRIIVETLVNAFNPTATLRESDLQGLI